MYQKLTEKIAGKPEERILSYLMLRSLKQARYSEENVGPLRAGGDELHAFHFADPALSGFDRAPDFEGSAAGFGGAADGEVPVGVSAGRPAVASGNGVASVRHATGRSRCWRFALVEAARPCDASRTAATHWRGPISLEELHDIAEESSQSERRADEAERELMEWKKVKFMQDRVGEDFDGLIISVTKFGFFVELTDLFVEGLVPLRFADRRPLHLSRKHARDHRPAQPQDLPPGAKSARAGGPDRSGGEENPVRGAGGSETTPPKRKRKRAATGEPARSAG